jgi:hypothetical protein
LNRNSQKSQEKHKKTSKKLITMEAILEKINRMSYSELDLVSQAVDSRRIWLERRDDWDREEREEYLRDQEEYEYP